MNYIQKRFYSLKPFFDYKYLSEHAQALETNARNRNVHDCRPHQVAKLYEEFRSLTSNINRHRTDLNSISKQMGRMAKEELDKPAKEAGMRDLKDKAKLSKLTIQGLQTQLTEVEQRLRTEADKIPNLSHPETPMGDESNAQQVSIHGRLHERSDQKFKDHYELATKLKLVDMEAGAQVAGSRFHYWTGQGALLELALVQWAISRAVKEGFVPHITPDVAKMSVVGACGFRPRSDEASQIYRISAGEDGEDPLCLVGTAEIPLVAKNQQQILDPSQLPVRMAGLSHCFRAEAGSRGRDTRGIYRLHQFTKLELVTLSLPEQSSKQLERLLDFQISLYQELGLTFRVLRMPTEELGASAYQKYDMEAWMPGRGGWGEISSCSNCTDFQARRLGIRTRGKDGRVEFVHTLNATGVAVPRIAVALLESFQTPDGRVRVPEVLRPWMMGIDILE